MSAIIKFKSFDEKRRRTFEQMYEKGFDPESFDEPPEGPASTAHVCYAPGLYKYRSFEDARRDDFERMIEHAHLKAANKGV